MPTLTVSRSSINDILAAVKAQLASYTGLDSGRIFEVARRRVPHFGAERDILLRPGRADPMDPMIEGGGRVDARVRRRLETVIRTRLELDQPDRDRIWLTETENARGHFQFEELVIDALEMFFPADSDGNHLTTEGMRFQGIGEPDKDERSEEKGWGESTIVWLLEYELPLDQSVQ